MEGERNRLSKDICFPVFLKDKEYDEKNYSLTTKSQRLKAPRCGPC